MTLLNKTIIGFAFLTLFVSACDRIENPVIIHDTSLDWTLYPNDTTVSPYPWPTWTANTNTLRNVLLEDYTGHTCINCPSAAVVAKTIEDNNPNRVFVMSVHASTTSGYQVPELPHLPLDHRTEAGNEYAQVFNVFFNPAGTVNRTLTGGNYYALNSAWTSMTATELSKPLDFNIQLQYNYYPQTNGLFIHTEVEALSDAAADQYTIINCLVRDTVIAPQIIPGGTVEEEYHHHSMLTNNINGTWGTPIFEGGVSSGQKEYNNFTYKLPDPIADTTFRIDNLSIITFISKNDTYEVMQVIKTSLN